MSFNSKKYNASHKECLFCKKTLPNNKSFCDIICEENLQEYQSISMPSVFVKRLKYFIRSEDKILKELSFFASRHNFSFDFVIDIFNKKKDDV